MNRKNGFVLYTWLHDNGPDAVAVLGGSAAPSLSLKDVISLSSDASATKASFRFDDVLLGLGSAEGKLELRQTLAATYESSKSHIKAENVVIGNGTTGSNHIVHRSLLKPGDHVVCQYPTYGPLISEPKDIGCEVSYLRLDPADAWSIDLEQLKGLIRPGKTKMLILNNPSNPTGTHFSTDVQRSLIEIAKQHNLIIHSDEIFRPLFYTDEKPTSMIEHADLDYDKIVTTSSLSKSYGLSGVRIGWIVTRSQEMLSKFLHYRLFSCQSTSQLDEIIATEVLGSRCRPGILDKHFNLAKTNLDLIQAFVDKHHDQCEWVRPTAGAVAFVKFKDPGSGEAVDDVEFCQKLMESKKVLLSPASSCFELGDQKDEFRGRTRVHFTTKTETVEKGLALLGEYLDEEKAKVVEEVVEDSTENSSPSLLSSQVSDTFQASLP